MWDYYTVVVTLRHVLNTEVIEECCDLVRGMTETQEHIATVLHQEIQKRGDWAKVVVEVSGRHGSNCSTVCRRGDT